jgi:hypothetical protein
MPPRPAHLLSLGAGPAIAVPSIKQRSDQVDFAAAMASAPFALSATRYADAAVANEPVPQRVRHEVHYCFTQHDLDWLHSTRAMLSKAQTSLTVAHAEAVFTALELASARNPEIPFGRVALTKEMLVSVGVDVTAFPPECEAANATRQYWVQKRTVLAPRPLMSELLVWPDEGSVPHDTPFLSREGDLDVWVRKAPFEGAPLQVQAEAALLPLRSFVEQAAEMAAALLHREQQRLQFTLAAIHELALVRAAGGLLAAATDDAAMYAAMEDLHAPLQASMASHALDFGVALGMDAKTEDYGGVGKRDVKPER